MSPWEIWPIIWWSTRGNRMEQSQRSAEYVFQGTMYFFRREKIQCRYQFALQDTVEPALLQRALQELEARGLLNTQRTAGRTVTEDKTMIAQLREQLAAEQIGAFLQMMEKLGYTRAQTLALLQQKAQEE